MWNCLGNHECLLQIITTLFFRLKMTCHSFLPDDILNRDTADFALQPRYNIQIQERAFLKRILTQPLQFGQEPQKGIVKKNNAARKKARLSRLVK